MSEQILMIYKKGIFGIGGKLHEIGKAQFSNSADYQNFNIVFGNFFVSATDEKVLESKLKEFTIIVEENNSEDK